MIVVIGSPILVRRDPAAPGRPAGLASDVAIAAAATGAAVQMVGKVGDDDDGDAILLSLASAGVGHSTVLRDPACATPTAGEPTIIAEGAAVAEGTADVSLDAALDAALEAEDAPEPGLPDGLPLEPADVALALRYLTEFRVVVIAAPLEPTAVREALDAAQFAGAHVVRLDAGADAAAGANAAAEADAAPTTVLGSPDRPDDAFALVVARYAASLDKGVGPGDAFAAAVREARWERAADG